MINDIITLPGKIRIEQIHGLKELLKNNYLTFTALEDGTITFNIWRTMGTDMITSISYSTDNANTWNTTNNTDNKQENLQISVEVNAGDKVLWKGDAEQLGFYDENRADVVGSFFSSDCDFNAEGNVMSMIYGDNFIDKYTLNYEGEFSRLFSDVEEEKSCSIIDASNMVLPATTLTTECYSKMFNGCSNLTTAPELPATTLTNHCYDCMFFGCSSLTKSPKLPATALADSCYVNMFNNCLSLTNASELPATTLTSWCYGNMFLNCTSLTKAPELPATTLANNCYMNMFYGCTSLVTAPELPATTLVNSCYQGMFYGCTNLNYIKAMFTTTPSSTYTTNWVYNVASSGTFVKNNAASWDVSGVNGIPSNWNIYSESEYTIVRHYEMPNSIVTSVNGVSGNITLQENVQADWNALSGPQSIINKPNIPTGTILYYDNSTGLLASDNYNYTFSQSLDNFAYVICYFRPSNNALSDTNAIPGGQCIIMLDGSSVLSGGEYVGTCTMQYLNNENRYAAYSCIINSAKTQFRIKYQQSLYGTASTNISNSSHGIYCYKIVGFTERLIDGSQGVYANETQLSKSVTGNGNAVTDINVNNHHITLNKNTTFLTEHQSLKTINNTSIIGSGNISINELPSVTSEDNGKILMVVNGAWALVSP